MQQIQGWRKEGRLKQRCVTGGISVFWVAGLLIAGSDSAFMPWVNGIGLLLFVCASLALGKRLHTGPAVSEKNVRVTVASASCRDRLVSERKEGRVVSGYALSA